MDVLVTDPLAALRVAQMWPKCNQNKAGPVLRHIQSPAVPASRLLICGIDRTASANPQLNDRAVVQLLSHLLSYHQCNIVYKELQSTHNGEFLL